MPLQNLHRQVSRYSNGIDSTIKHTIFIHILTCSCTGCKICTRNEFISTLKDMRLDFNLGNNELERVFNSLDENGDGLLSLDEFRRGGVDHPFTKSVMEALRGEDALHVKQAKDAHFPEKDFDWTLSTAEFTQPL